MVEVAHLSSEPARPKAIVELLDYQLADVESGARFQWNCWARQTGKSFTKTLRRILRGLARGRNQIFLSAGARQSKELMTKAQAHCRALNIAAEAHGDRFFRGMSIKQLEITLPGGVRIIGLPANPSTARGFTGDVLLDEFAMHTDDRQIWAAMFPTLLRGAGELDIASTPRGKSNLFYELGQNPMFHTHTLTLPEAMAGGLQAEPGALRAAMGDDTLYRQEFLCEFLDGTTAFLTYDDVKACTSSTLSPARHPDQLVDENRDMFVGVDVGRVRDLTVMWVVARQGSTLETVGLIELHDTPFRRQWEYLEALLRHRCVRHCCTDAGGLGMQLAEQAVERFGAYRVEAVTFTQTLKSRVAGGLRLAVEQRSILIPDDPRIISDWHSVERTVSNSGHLRLASPRREGSHADRFWAAALAIQAASAASGPVSYLRGSRISYAREGIW